VYINRNIVVGAIVALVAIMGIVMIANAANNDGTQDTKVSKNIEDRRGDAFPGPGNSLVKTDVATCPGDVELHKSSDKVTVEAGCVVKGDVVVIDNSGNINAANKSDDMGNLLHCPSGCVIVAAYGANVSNREFDDLLNEQFELGCKNGCPKVHEWIYEDGKLKLVKTHVPDDTKAPTATAEPTKTPTTQPIDDGCEPELKLGEKRVIAKGCIVVGDVAVRKAGSSDEFKPVFDNRQKTGTVQQLTEDYEVWNIQGASVYPAGFTLESAVAATKMAGCGTGYGCPDGIFDWNGNRLDQ